MTKRLAACFLAGMLAGCAGMGETLSPPPTTAEIVQMAKSGESAEFIIERMDRSRAVYPLPASELARLHADGVPDKVIDYMQQTYLESVRHEEWERMRGAYFYYPAPYSFGPPRRYWRSPYGW